MKRILAAIIVLTMMLVLTVSAHAKAIIEWNEDLHGWEITRYDDDDNGPLPSRVDDAGTWYTPVPIEKGDLP